MLSGFLDLSSIRLVEVVDVDLSVYPDHARWTDGRADKVVHRFSWKKYFIFGNFVPISRGTIIKQILLQNYVFLRNMYPSAVFKVTFNFRESILACFGTSFVPVSIVYGTTIANNKAVTFLCPRQVCIYIFKHSYGHLVLAISLFARMILNNENQ